MALNDPLWIVGERDFNPVFKYKGHFIDGLMKGPAKLDKWDNNENFARFKFVHCVDLK